jgi:spermidine synthase
MKQAWWKSTWSHITDIHIESIESEKNKNLEVYLSKGRYQLCVKDAIYSFGDKYDNYWDTFDQMDVGKFQDKEILILGFGMGSIPFMLQKKGISAQYTGIEYDETVTYLYNKYVGDEIESPTEIITADAHQFMLLNNRKFDLIAMDVFVEDVIPIKFLETEFVERLKASLSEDGLLIWNFLYHFEKDRNFVDNFFNETFGKIFGNGSFVQTRGNKMLLNKKIVNSQAK